MSRSCPLCHCGFKLGEDVIQQVYAEPSEEGLSSPATHTVHFDCRHLKFDGDMPDDVTVDPETGTRSDAGRS